VVVTFSPPTADMMAAWASATVRPYRARLSRFEVEVEEIAAGDALREDAACPLDAPQPPLPPAGRQLDFS